MSHENVETVRGVYARWSQGDFRTGVDVLDPLVLFVLRPEFPDAGSYLGLERLGEYMRGLLEPWTRLTIEAEEIIDAGDSVVVALVQRGVGDGSGAPTEFHYFHVWSFRGRKVIRLECIRQRADALEAVGLLE
jgi:ketosteroid isomerase-like protein